MPEKIGVYFDEAALGSALDAGELGEVVKNKFAGLTPVIRSHHKLASEEGRALIQADLDNGDIDAVLVVGASPRYDWDIFAFGDVPTERVNMREVVVKGYKNPDGTTPAKGEKPDLLANLARDYVKMGVAKLMNYRPVEPEMAEMNKTILVLGGGWTGLTAALNAAAVGYEVVIVEKEAELGGKATQYHKSFPMRHPYTDKLVETGIQAKIDAAKNNPKITVKTGATLKKLEGAPGLYTAKLGNGEEFACGAMILATGWTPQQTEYLEPLGFGKDDNVVTAMQFEEMAKAGGPIKRPSDGQPAKSVCFITDINLCMRTFEEEVSEAEKAISESDEDKEGVESPEAGAEQAAADAEGDDEKVFVYHNKEKCSHLAYSSELASLVALKQANYITEMNDGQAYIFYDHMMVPGINELYYKAAQDSPGVMLAKGYISGVKKDNGSLVVSATNTLLGENIELEADMVVVPTGMVPVTAHDPTINLAYRQGPAFPELELFDGFADSNYICFPYETRRTGVYAAGCVRQPMTMATAEEDAAGAALKAIQCISSANRGVSVHPRSGDQTYPVFNFVRCTQCKRCTEECPFGALDDDPKGTPMPNPTRCRRCGTCMGACPERVISFDNYSVGMVGNMIKEVEVPAMDKGGPRAIVLACENDAYPAMDMAAMRDKPWSPYVRVIPVRCLGSVNTIWIADAMGKGIDGVLLLGCKYGDDYQCHFIKGSELCNRRMENVAETLNRLGVEPERVKQEQVAIDEYDKIPEIVDGFMNYILKIGPNPFKGF